MSRWKVKKIPMGWWVGNSTNGVYFSTLKEAHSHAMKQSRMATFKMPQVSLNSVDAESGATIHRSSPIPLSTPEPGVWSQKVKITDTPGHTSIYLSGPYGDIYWCDLADVRSTALHLLAICEEYKRGTYEPGCSKKPAHTTSGGVSGEYYAAIIGQSEE